MHLYAWFHAWLHSLFGPSETDLTKAMHASVLSLLREHGLASQKGHELQIERITDDVWTSLGAEADREAIAHLLSDLLEYEELFAVPTVDWTEHRSVSELWKIRDELAVRKHTLENLDHVEEIIALTIARALKPLLSATPKIEGAEDGITVQTKKLDLIANLPATVERVVKPLVHEDLDELDILPRLKRTLDRNIIAASGGNPDDPKAYERVHKPPSQSNITDKRQLVSTYLGNTPFASLFAGNLPFTIPTKTRFEHHHIVAGSGHGKTQTLQYLIANDLEAVSRGKASVVVLDSQGDLIRTISQLKVFAPGEPLHDRICIIDPTDVEYPVSLNLFDVGQERLSTYPMLERERLTNSILELYDFVLGTLLSAEMTQKQTVIFRYVTRLMLHIPDATIHTLRELMEPGSEKTFAAHIEKLEGTARQFFETEFPSREFSDTRKQVLRRLWGILENQTFERMFSHPRSKLDLFSEMNAGKVILINTAKDLLKESGTEIFGRFFIAMIAQAAQERATLPEGKRMPTFVYVDEAADYFDRNIGIILSQARKFKVGMVLAHQYLGQLDPKLQDAVAANTAIKFAGGVSNKDARALGPMLGSTPEFIEGQKKGSFAAFVRGSTANALPLSFPLGHMEKLPRMEKEERQALQATMREKYAVFYKDLSVPVPQKAPEPEPAQKPAPKPPTQAQPKPKPKKPKPPKQPSTDPTPGW